MREDTFEKRSPDSNLVLLYRFANLTTLIESQVVGQNSRESIDAAYEKLVSNVFSSRLMQYEVLAIGNMKEIKIMIVT